jgi:hypothetical protein
MEVWEGLLLACVALVVLWKVGLGRLLYVILDVLFFAMIDGARPDRRD